MIGFFLPEQLPALRRLFLDIVSPIMAGRSRQWVET
jgi:hypothetical protein